MTTLARVILYKNAWNLPDTFWQDKHRRTIIHDPYDIAKETAQNLDQDAYGIQKEGKSLSLRSTIS